MSRPAHQLKTAARPRTLWPRRLWLALAVALGLAPGAARADDSLAAAVKATFLYKFVPFVDWPPAATAAADGPLQLCVVGDDPFGPLLDRAVAGVRVAGRPIAVRRMAAAERRSGCEIMFVGGSRAQTPADVVAAVKGDPVLTVTDDKNVGAVVDFVTQNGHVRFRIDNQAAADNGLTLSSKLLNIALSVTPRR